MLSTLTEVAFEQNVTYQIQLLNPAYLREGLVGRGFLVNTTKPFLYLADAPLYIASPPTPFGTITLNISKEESDDNTVVDSEDETTN